MRQRNSQEKTDTMPMVEGEVNAVGMKTYHYYYYKTQTPTN